MEDWEFEERDNPGGAILTDAQIKYITQSETGNYSGKQVEKQLKQPIIEAANSLPARIQRLLDDIVLIDSHLTREEKHKSNFFLLNLYGINSKAVKYNTDTVPGDRGSSSHLGFQLGSALYILYRNIPSKDKAKRQSDWSRFSSIDYLLDRYADQKLDAELSGYKKILAGMFYAQIKYESQTDTEISERVNEIASQIAKEVESLDKSMSMEEYHKDHSKKRHEDFSDVVRSYNPIRDEEIISIVSHISKVRRDRWDDELDDLFSGRSEALQLAEDVKNIIRDDIKSLEPRSPFGISGEAILEALTTSFLKKSTESEETDTDVEYLQRTDEKNIIDRIMLQALPSNKESFIKTYMFQNHVDEQLDLRISERNYRRNIDASSGPTTKSLRYLAKEYDRLATVEPVFPIVEYYEEKDSWNLTPYGVLVLAYRLDSRYPIKIMYSYVLDESTGTPRRVTNVYGDKVLSDNTGIPDKVTNSCAHAVVSKALFYLIRRAVDNKEERAILGDIADESGNSFEAALECDFVGPELFADYSP